MIIAYEAVVSKRMSFKEACTKFKIPDSTLRDRVKRGNHMKGRRGQNATLDQNQSEKLTKCIMMLLKQGYYTIDELSSYQVNMLRKQDHSGIYVDCLSAFERMFTDNCKNSVSGSQLERSALCKDVLDAYQHAFTCDEIQRSFRMSKIFPIHTEMI
ncbi:unnamed protein product [Mytilus coruscus]|uniref:HTH psq-type domain-containing protein n=1 Tax=Mytilus coruscus TaxID=42192 RepID=A0A6J8EW08_MYTCO|nr:unnamed protein product [Mytilus coruscus]